MVHRSRPTGRPAALAHTLGRFLAGFGLGLLVLASLGGTLGAVQSKAAPPRNATARQVSANARQHFSSMHYISQYFRDHMRNPAALRRLALEGRNLPHAPLFTAPGGALSFNSDTSIATQNEEAVAVDPTTPGGNAAGTITVGGFNDWRGFYFPTTNTESGFAVSQTVSCGSGSSCAHLLTDGWIPGVTDPLCTDGSVLVPQGDPSLAVNAAGTFFYATEAFPPINTGSGIPCSESNSDSGIIVAVSTPQLKTGGCTSGLTTNTCWTSFLIDTESIFTCTSNCAEVDKPWITVDPASGQITVVWDYVAYGSFSPNTVCVHPSGGATCVVYQTCTLQAGPSLSCSAPKVPPCATSCLASYGPYLAVWHNPASGKNEVLLTFEETIYQYPCDSTPNECLYAEQHLADLTTNTDRVVNTLTGSEPLQAVAFDQYNIQCCTGDTGLFPIFTQTKITADSRAVTTPYFYVTYDYCPPSGSDGNGASYYFDYSMMGPPVSTGFGVCARPQVVVDRFSSVTGAPTAMTIPSGYDQTMPSVAVDEAGASAGTVTLAYYSTNDDPLHAGMRVYVAQAAAGSTSFGAPYTNILSANNAYTSDPAIGLGLTPEIGDYFQVAAQNGAIFVHFTANFEQKTGPAILDTVPANQEDNYLCYIVPSTPSSSASPCNSA